MIFKNVGGHTCSYHVMSLGSATVERVFSLLIFTTPSTQPWKTALKLQSCLNNKQDQVSNSPLAVTFCCSTIIMPAYALMLSWYYYAQNYASIIRKGLGGGGGGGGGE